MKLLPLTLGMFSKVDDSDYEILKDSKWHAHKSDQTYYAATVLNGKTPVYLHHLIIGKPGPGRCVDHANGDSLDNQRSNLRICTRSQNNMNRRTRRKLGGLRGTSKLSGNRVKPWVAEIYHEGKKVRLGTFTTAEAAHEAYAAASKKYHGEFSCLQ